MGKCRGTSPHVIHSAQDGGEMSAAHPGHLNSWENSQNYPLNRKLGGHGIRLTLENARIHTAVAKPERNETKRVLFVTFYELYRFCTKSACLEHPACALSDPTAMTFTPWNKVSTWRHTVFILENRKENIHIWYVYDVRCDCNWLYVPINVHKMYENISYVYTYSVSTCFG